MNIVLTGLRGSGKSHYSKKLSKLLSWKIVDTDNLIKEREKKTITEIVQDNGWKYFRNLEREIAKEVGQLDEHVISTGGGMIINRENEQELKKNGKIVFLYRTPGKCAEFIERSSDKDRPPLTEKQTILEELTETWEKREKRYTESADLIIDVNEELSTEHILELLENS